MIDSSCPCTSLCARSPTLCPSAPCPQAFQALVGSHKLSNAEELELVASLKIPPEQACRACRAVVCLPAEGPAGGYGSHYQLV